MNTISVPGSLYSVSPPEYHAKSHSPPSPMGASGPSLGPPINPSSDIESAVRTFPMASFSFRHSRSSARSILPFRIQFILPQWLSLIAELPGIRLLRLYEKSSNTGEAPRHEANHGSVHQR